MPEAGAVHALGRYQVLRELGRGAMGTVYLGHDPLRDRPVALKVAAARHFRDATQGALYRRLFYNEMRTAALLHHPNIVEVYDAGVEGGTFYFAMEYVPGGLNLETYCRPGFLMQPARAVETVCGVAEALDFAHRKGVIHRDIKPSNILLTDGGQPKLGDFSVALLTDQSLVETQILDPIGSPLYMAPEHFRDEAVTAQSDIFSLALVLYELLTGRHPFAAGSLARLSQRVLHEDVPAPGSLVTGLPPELDAVLARALAKAPAARFATALDFAEALAAVFGSVRPPQDAVATEGRVVRLRRLGFFSEFDEAEMWELLRWTLWEDYPPGAVLIGEAEEDDTVYIVVSGRVSVRKGGREVATLGPGECIGEIGYLARRRRTASVVARTAVSVLRANAALLGAASVGCRVQFQNAFIRTLIERLVQTTEQLARLAGRCDPPDGA